MNGRHKLGTLAAALVVALVGVYLLRGEDRASPVAAGELRPTGGAELEHSVEQPRAPKEREAVEASAAGDGGGGAAADPALPGSPSAPAAVEEEPVSTAARVVGRCVDQDLLPVEGARVGCESRDLETVCGPDGRFLLTVPIFGGSSLRLRLSSEGYGRTEFEVPVRSGETTDVGDVLLRAASAVAGLVVDAAGVGRAGATVQVEEALDVAEGDIFGGADLPVVEAGCDELGAFRLEGVAPGRIRLWAGGEGLRWTSTDPIEVLPAEDVLDLRLVVVPLERDDTIELVVLDAEAHPVPGARVSYRYSTGYQTGTGSITTDEGGRARKFLHIRTPHSFLATDPAGRLRSALARDVAPGTHDLVLRLGAATSFDLRVRDAAGRAVHELDVELVDLEREFDERKGTRELEPGLLEVVTPPYPFTITVDAPGFELAELGPFEPNRVPDRVEAELVALPLFRGTVTAAGRPVGGARVTLHELVAPDQRYEVNGFAARTLRHWVADGSTGPDGTFALTLRSGGSYVLRGEAPAYAPGEAGPFELDPRSGGSGLDLELVPGGAIAGSVLLFAGEEPSGIIVGASRGDGYGVTRRTDAGGAYRFDGLTPGRWYVCWRQDEVRSGSVMSTSGGARGEVAIPWSCEVRSGETTVFDLDLRALQEATLHGRFRMAGRALSEWTAALEPLDAGRVSVSASLDGEGRFALTVPWSGAYRLSLHGMLESSSFVDMQEEVALVAGDQEWSLDLEAGVLQGTLVRGLVDEDSLRYEWDGAGGRTYRARIVAKPDGTFRVPAVPAGVGRLAWRAPGGDGSEREVQVVPGRVTHQTLPE